MDRWVTHWLDSFWPLSSCIIRTTWTNIRRSNSRDWQQVCSTLLHRMLFICLLWCHTVLTSKSLIVGVIYQHLNWTWCFLNSGKQVKTRQKQIGILCCHIEESFCFTHCLLENCLYTQSGTFAQQTFVLTLFDCVIYKETSCTLVLTHICVTMATKWSLSTVLTDRLITSFKSGLSVELISKSHNTALGRLRQWTGAKLAGRQTTTPPFQVVSVSLFSLQQSLIDSLHASVSELTQTGSHTRVSLNRTKQVRCEST